MAGCYYDQKGLWMMSGEIWFGGSSQDSIDYEIVHFNQDKLKFGIFWRNNNEFITGREWGGEMLVGAFLLWILAVMWPIRFRNVSFGFWGIRNAWNRRKNKNESAFHQIMPMMLWAEVLGLNGCVSRIEDSRMSLVGRAFKKDYKEVIKQANRKYIASNIFNILKVRLPNISSPSAFSIMVFQDFKNRVLPM